MDALLNYVYVKDITESNIGGIWEWSTSVSNVWGQTKLSMWPVDVEFEVSHQERSHVVVATVVVSPRSLVVQSFLPSDTGDRRI